MSPTSVAWAGLLAIAHLAAATTVDVAAAGFLSEKQDPFGVNEWTITAYGQSKCPCIGVDHLSGFYATQLDFYHVQNSLSTGTSCGAWDLHTHPWCEGGDGPDWCFERWCYVDPCNCDTEGLPAMSVAGVEFHGGPAYFSYETCGFLDEYSKEMSPEACINQKNVSMCSKHNDKCAWDGKRCGGKEVVETCAAASSNHDTTYGQEDCRCVGVSGRMPGRAYLSINDEERVHYSPDVGSYCHDWEAESHPDCTKDGEKPAFCSAKWCFVDPCKCSTKSPAKSVLAANQALTYQGKTAYWSSETCGSDDSWTAAHSTKYCVAQQTEKECNAMKDHCSWTGKDCLGTALAEICAEQQDSGVLGFEVGRETSSAEGVVAPFMALILALVPSLCAEA